MGPSNFVRLLPLAAVIIVPAAARASDQPLLLPPSSSWVVDYAEDSCALRRTFSDGRINAVLEMRQSGPGNGYEIRIGSDTLERTRRAPRIRYGADEAWSEPGYPSLLDGGGWHGVLFEDSLRPAMPNARGGLPEWPAAERDARETAVTQVTIERTFERELTLQVGRMHAPLEAMRACMRELVPHWGLDADVQETLSRPAEPKRQLVDWLRRTAEDYPTEMRRFGESARVPIRLIVGADGNPTGCAIARDSVEASFAEVVCASSMRTARFEPARDAAGRPVASYFLTTIVYRVAL